MRRERPRVERGRGESRAWDTRVPRSYGSARRIDVVRVTCSLVESKRVTLARSSDSDASRSGTKRLYPSHGQTRRTSSMQAKSCHFSLQRAATRSREKRKKFLSCPTCRVYRAARRVFSRATGGHVSHDWTAIKLLEGERAFSGGKSAARTWTESGTGSLSQREVEKCMATQAGRVR